MGFVVHAHRFAHKVGNVSLTPSARYPPPAAPPPHAARPPPGPALWGRTHRAPTALPPSPLTRPRAPPRLFEKFYRGVRSAVAGWDWQLSARLLNAMQGRFGWRASWGREAPSSC